MRRETVLECKHVDQHIFLVPTERNHHTIISRRHTAPSAAARSKIVFQAEDCFSVMRLVVLEQMDKRPQGQSCGDIQNHAKALSEGRQKEVGSSVTFVRRSFRSKMTTFSIFPSISFVQGYYQGSLWGIGCNKKKYQQRWWFDSVTFQVRKMSLSLVGVCFCVHFFLPDAHDHCLIHLCSYYPTMCVLIRWKD